MESKGLDLLDSPAFEPVGEDAIDAFGDTKANILGPSSMSFTSKSPEPAPAHNSVGDHVEGAVDSLVGGNLDMNSEELNFWCHLLNSNSATPALQPGQILPMLGETSPILASFVGHDVGAAYKDSNMEMKMSAGKTQSGTSGFVSGESINSTVSVDSPNGQLHCGNIAVPHKPLISDREAKSGLAPGRSDPSKLKTLMIACRFCGKRCKAIKKRGDKIPPNASPLLRHFLNSCKSVPDHIYKLLRIMQGVKKDQEDAGKRLTRKDVEDAAFIAIVKQRARSQGVTATKFAQTLDQVKSIVDKCCHRVQKLWEKCVRNKPTSSKEMASTLGLVPKERCIMRTMPCLHCSKKISVIKKGPEGAKANRANWFLHLLRCEGLLKKLNAFPQLRACLEEFKKAVSLTVFETWERAGTCPEKYSFFFHFYLPRWQCMRGDFEAAACRIRSQMALQHAKSSSSKTPAAEPMSVSDRLTHLTLRFLLDLGNYDASIPNANHVIKEHKITEDLKKLLVSALGRQIDVSYNVKIRISSDKDDGYTKRFASVAPDVTADIVVFYKGDLPPSLKPQFVEALTKFTALKPCILDFGFG